MSIVDNLKRRVPLKILPTMADAVVRYRSEHTSKVAWMDGFVPMLKDLSEKPEIGCSYLKYEPATGKYRCYRHPIQLIPRLLRPHLTSSIDGHSILSVDYSASHVRIAATKLQDPGLIALLEDPNPYEKHGKVELIASLNGGGSTEDLREEFPVLAELRDTLEAARVDVRTILGRRVPGTWRTHLAAFWSIPEALAMNYALSNLHKVTKAHLVMPLFDSIVVSVDPADSDEVSAQISELMLVGMRRVGVEAQVKVKSGTNW